MSDPRRTSAPISLGRRALRALVLVLAAFLLALAIANALDYPLRWSLGPLRLTSREPGRPLAAAAIVAAVAVALHWRVTRWRRVSIAMLVASAAIALCIRERWVTFPAGDAALIEISTLHAARGRQILGAYSQFGWHHPGPLGFYWLAPFYVVGGETTHALNTGVMFGNLLALAILAWIVAVRHGRTAVSLSVSLLGMLALYLTRIPDLLLNGWNPHTPVLPLVAILFVTAATLAGDRGLWALALVLTSFVVQTHVGFAIVAGGLCALTMVVTLWRDWRERHSGGAPFYRLAAMTFVIEALWIFPLAEQVVHTPGNMRLILEFFFQGRATQTFDHAWRAWGATLTGVFRPGFRLSVGIGLELPPAIWSIAGVAIVAALLPCAWLASRQRRVFLSCLSRAALVASLLGLYSVVRVVGILGDYHIFWLSALGVINAAIVLATLLSAIDARMPETTRQWIVRASSWGMVMYATYLGVAPAFVPYTRGAPDPMTAGLSRIMSEIDAGAPSLKTRRTVVRLGEGLWGEGAGIVLQLMRERQPITVAPEMVWMFGDSLASDGREEQLLTIARPGEHETLMQRPGNVVVGTSGMYYADLIDLVDHPEFRPH